MNGLYTEVASTIVYFNHFTLLENKNISSPYRLCGDSQIDLNSKQKNVYCSKLIPIQSLYRSERNIFFTRVVYLMIYTCIYFIIPIRK